jgi:hypothetical protein
MLTGKGLTMKGTLVDSQAVVTVMVYQLKKFRKK